MRPSAVKTQLAICTLLCLGSLFFCLTKASEAQDLEWSGSVKSLDIHGRPAPAGSAPDYTLSGNRARLDLSWQAKTNLLFEAAFDYQYIWSDPGAVFTVEEDIYNRHLDMSHSWQHGEHGLSRLQIDRLKLQWRQGPLDVTIGRQPLGFGRILIYSPLDVIAPFAPDAIDIDIRSGVDALHAIYNYGLDGQLGAIVLWGEENRYNSHLLTWTDNRSGLDLLLLGGELRGRKVLGAGLAGSLGTLGLKAEFSIHDGRDVDQPGGDLYESYILAAVEAWYRFDNGISLVAEYLYNGPGSDDPEKYQQVLASAPLQEGLTHLLGRHYLIIAPAYEVHPLATLQGLLIYNIEDESALMRPTLELSLADNLSLQCFWAWHAGRAPDVAASPLLVTVPRSEFGLRGDSGGIFLSWYF